ncbi:MAG TPA: HAD family hydrolase [Polyangiaceae bacterium]|nr:HAD family hydrolase [Polyangiaceae bacterium]
MSATAVSVSPTELVRELEGRLRADRPSGLSFDADGTLWSGDVGEDVFRFAVDHGRLREAARGELDRQAQTRGFQCFADPNQTAQRLFEAYLAGSYPEREICELMTWCYAGYSPAEMAELVREALTAANHAQRANEELGPILEFARKRGLRTIVVSASPRITVELAARVWGFDAQDIAAATPRVVSGIIAAEMAGTVPYGTDKCLAGRELLGSTHWLGAFGDNVFDMDMLLEAELGVAVRPKPALRARLGEIPGVRLLDANFQAR